MPLSRFVLIASLLLTGVALRAEPSDERELVPLPPMMQQHMLANMRDHLVALHEIISDLHQAEWESAADTAENRLGVSSLDAHGAHHMGKKMPQGMREIGMQMHRSASRFALKAQEGDVQVAYQALSGITQACVACHAAYKIR